MGIVYVIVLYPRRGFVILLLINYVASVWTNAPRKTLFHYKYVLITSHNMCVMISFLLITFHRITPLPPATVDYQY